MSNHIKEAFVRTNMQYIREFIRYGSESINKKDESYHERLETGCEPIFSRMKSLYPDEKELDEAHNDLSHALSAYEDVYMEVGMKIGARLLYQLLFLDE